MSRFCEQCGAPLNSDENFCTNCGAKVLRDESPPVTKPSPTTNSTPTSSTQQRVAEFYAKKKAAAQKSKSTPPPETTTEHDTDSKRNDSSQPPVQATPATSSSKDDDKQASLFWLKIIGGVFVLSILIGMAVSPSKNTSYSPPKPTQTEETPVKRPKPQSETVPDVVGKTQSDAVAALKAAGVEVKISDSYSDSVPAGTIISQSPNSGAKIEKGQTVYVYVSKGVDPAKSPAPLTKADLAIGDLTLGMSPQVVEQKLGSFFPTHYNILYGDNDAVILVRCTGGEAKTPRGIHIGSTLADVENAYGKNYSTESASDKTLYSYHLENADLNFLINAAGRVDTIAFYVIYADAPSAETPKPSPPPAPKPANDGYNYTCTVGGTTTYKGIIRNGIACALYDWQTQKQMSFEYLGTYTARGNFYIVTAIVGNGTNAPIMTPTLYLVDERGRKYSSNDNVTSAYDANRNIEIELMLNPGQPQYAYEVFDIPDGVNITSLRCEAFTADFDAVEFNLPFRVVTE